MKHVRIPVFALVLLLIVGAGMSPLHAQELPTNSITVTGFGTAYGAPDTAYIELGAEFVDPDLPTAFNQTSEAITRLNDALSAFGDSVTVQTSGVSVFPEDRFDPQSGMPTGERTYRVRNTARVTVRDVAIIEDVLTSAINSGANTIYNFSYGIGDPSALESEARTLAVANARARAEQLAAELGVTVGAPIIISEGVAGGGVPVPFLRETGGGFNTMAQSMPVSEGLLDVNVQIQVTFAIGS